MSLLGVHLSLRIGPAVPVPAPASMMAVLRSAEITHSDEGRSGFQLVFAIGRSGDDVADYALLADPLVAVGNRVVIGLTVAGVPSILFDGFITTQELTPSVEPGATTLTLTGEDASYQMDQEERSEEYPGHSDEAIVRTILARYAGYGVLAEVSTLEVTEQPTVDEDTPAQQGTDYAYLQILARRYGYVFYIVPGPLVGQARAIWGPPARTELEQPPLSVNLGAASNVEGVELRYDGLAGELYQGWIQDRGDNGVFSIRSVGTSRAPLAAGDPLRTARLRIYRDSAADHALAFAKAQALTDSSVDNAVEASGELDTGRYGDILQARGLVTLRGVGAMFDGTWYVRSVTHQIARGSYKQRFTLAREALGAIGQHRSLRP